jgi:hypothetical protein
VKPPCTFAAIVAATASGLFTPDFFEEICWLMAKYYNDALVGVETAVFGYAVNKGLERRGTNLYYPSSDANKQSPRPGFQTDSKTRPMILDKGREELEKNTSEVRDEKILNQMLTFIRNPKKGGRPEADGTMKDDGVMAWSIAGALIDEHPYRPRKTTYAGEIYQPTERKPNAGFTFGRK